MILMLLQRCNATEESPAPAILSLTFGSFILLALSFSSFFTRGDSKSVHAPVPSFRHLGPTGKVPSGPMLPRPHIPNAHQTWLAKHF